MKSPSRRLRRLVGAGTAALLAVGLAPILTSGVAQAASTNTPAIAVANQTVIGVGQAGSAAGALVIGSSTTTFNAGDQITVQVTQPGVGTPTITTAGAPPTADAPEMNPNCNGGSTGAGIASRLRLHAGVGAGDRRFVAYAATPTAAGPAGGTLTLLPGVPVLRRPPAPAAPSLASATARTVARRSTSTRSSWPRPARAPSRLTTSSTTLVAARV